MEQNRIEQTGGNRTDSFRIEKAGGEGLKSLDHAPFQDLELDTGFLFLKHHSFINK